MHSHARKTSPRHRPSKPLAEELNQLLLELTKNYESMLKLLDEKQVRLCNLDGPGLKDVTAQERQAAAQLERYVRHREHLLSRAAQSGIRADSLRGLLGHLPSRDQQRAMPLLEQVRMLGKTVRGRCLTNWVLGQRALLHTGQLLQILGAGGSEATYGRSQSVAPGGTLIDQAV